MNRTEHLAYMRKYSRQWHKYQPKSKHVQHNKEWRKRHPDVLRKDTYSWRKSHPNAMRKINRRYYLKHKEHYKKMNHIEYLKRKDKKK